MVVYTIGHSTRSFEQFTTLLRAAGVARVVDVRAFPMSRRHPQFNKDALSVTLPAAGFESPRESIVFDRFAGDEDAARAVFAPGSGIPFYGGRRTRFLYVVTNSFRGGTASPGWWDTTTLPPGEYTLRILAGDIRGNLALRNRDVPITVAAWHP
jgi:hypothetical protein